jgi:hypothetical protein
MTNAGGLFSSYFLDVGITGMPAWSAVDAAAIAAVRSSVAALIGDFNTRAAPGEADTERDLIEPLLTLLGWTDRVVQTAAGRSDVPDFLLFPSAAAKSEAVRLARSAERYRHGATILEAKAWELPLDRGTDRSPAPSTQMLRYLGTVEIQSAGNVRFGILTNGRCWRLYDQKARSRLEGFVEIDLVDAVDGTAPADHQLRLFLTLFARAAFLPDISGATTLTAALDASRAFEARVTTALAATVFDTVFPDLANALAAADPGRPAVLDRPYLDALREAALTWLYRLLFTLYAEDRDLLPTRGRDDGLWAMRQDIAAKIDAGYAFATRRANYDGDLRALWSQIDTGDDGIGLPPYNGGLFAAERSPLLTRAVLPDHMFAPLLDAMSRERTATQPRFINYRDLSVQHLGSVYERLLEFDLTGSDPGAGISAYVAVRPQTFARKTSGSYYTPEDLVMLVIRRTLGPLLDERRAAFAAARPADRAAADPATAFTRLRIVDPAMGSGHFLVSLVDYLADETMRATDDAAAAYPDYRSPLLDRLAAIRDRIMAEAAANRWSIDDKLLVDRQLVRRIILKRVIHGVDKNPMAVELAKLSLWLHTFTVGAPLSFLDHHLRCGDSLFGEWVRPAIDRMRQGAPLFRFDAIARAERITNVMTAIEEASDADLVEVHQSRDNFSMIEAETAEAAAMFSFLQGYRWVEAGAVAALAQARKLRKAATACALRDPAEAARLSAEAAALSRRGIALDKLLEGEFGPPAAALDIAYGRIGDPDQALDQLAKAAQVARAANFFHWEIAFPGVWGDTHSAEPTGGFDAVIGNPPWDRLKMQEVEWFAARRRAIAAAPRASDRAAMIGRLRDVGDPLAADFAQAAEMAALAARMAGLEPDKGGQFALLGGGDVNLYSLFVERAARLIAPNGMVGLLTPSGIAGDLGAAPFFKSISTSGRLAALLDYANRPAVGAREFFPDVHRSFKFCAVVFGGAGRRFDAATCGFFLPSTRDDEIDVSAFPMTPADFAAVNPNTGTAPVFRSRRDADLTTAIYARLPVLVDHRVRPPRMPWPVKYSTMFHMTNDSHLFRTRAELAADGWYPVAAGRMKRGAGEAVPLYEGKMVQAFDHRAASVIVNADNLHRAAQPEATTSAQHQNPDWLPDPQYFVEEQHVAARSGGSWHIAFKDVTAPTNVRTMIAAAVPAAAYGNTLPIISSDPTTKVLLLANLNAFALDYTARQKVQGQHVNWFIVEQLPVIPPAAYDRTFGPLTARDIVRREVLALTYTAHDMNAFARELGYDGQPFAWDEAARRQRRARLDALYFHLYGFDAVDADYILSTFPIVARHDVAEHGRFLTRDLILGHMAALAAGDLDAIIVPR